MITKWASSLSLKVAFYSSYMTCKLTSFYVALILPFYVLFNMLYGFCVNGTTQYLKNKIMFILVEQYEHPKTSGILLFELVTLKK